MNEIFSIPDEQILFVVFALGAFSGVIWCIFLYALDTIIEYIKSKKK